MMIVHITAIDFDLLGQVIIKPLPGSDRSEVRRRINRVPTLDGGSVFNDGGFTHSDGTISLRWRTVSQAHNDAVERLVQLHPLLYVSTAAGFFSAAPERFAPGPVECRLPLWIKEKLA